MMMMPSILEKTYLTTTLDGFSFPDIDKELYGKHAKNLMKTDVEGKEDGVTTRRSDPDLRFKKDEITAELKDGYLTISAPKGLDKDEKDKEVNTSAVSVSAGQYEQKLLCWQRYHRKKDIHGKYENGILMLDIPKKARRRKSGRKKSSRSKDKRTFPGMIERNSFYI